MRHAIVAAKADGHVSEDAFEAAGAPDSGDRPRLSAASEFGWEQALWLATRGGAEAVGLEHVGYFGVGMQFDALNVDCAGGGAGAGGSGALCVFPWDTLRDRVQKFVHLGT
jgi:cytosine/adenosine deaminase-related metal-dependent hydrolase